MSSRLRIAAAVLVLGAVIPETGSSTAHAQSDLPADTGGCTAPEATSTSGSSFSAAETLCRTYFDQGVVDVRNFQVNVSDTQGLRNGQVITVSWSGAHPTGGIVSDEQLSTAADQEYPIVLMECRGTGSPTAPASEQISPETCWTAGSVERINTSVSAIQPMWKLDSYNSPADQANQVNIPSSVPKACGFVATYSYWLPFVATDGTSYPIGPNGCAGSPPEMLTFNENPSIVPSDTTYAETAPDGTGSTKFTVMTSEVNQSLGCSQTVQCSLVIVPIEGISCNANPTYRGEQEFDCENPGDFGPGELNVGQSPFGPALSDEGQFWWSQSNWGRRISVPLNFATPADACARNTSSPIQFYGSELMVQATQQWNPYFCLNPKLFNVEQTQLSEPQSKQSVQQGFVEAAIQAAPPESAGFFTKPTVQAPIGLTGFAIAYVIDNSDGTPYTQLKLDPRLLAKLLTESYYGTNNVLAGDPGIATNPRSIYNDPEFQILNPTFVAPNGIQPAPAATLFSILTRSDVVWALTSYIDADPEARAWLDGQPDPWGMVVNPAYKGIKLPVESWPLLDTSTNGPDYTAAGNPFCLAALGAGKARIPDRPLVDNPQNSLLAVAINLEYSIASSLITCNNDPNAPSYIPLGPEVLGNRFLIGLVSLPEAANLDLDLAELQTYANPEVETIQATKFVANRAFVGPSEASLEAAAALLQPDSPEGTWTMPYFDFHGDATAKAAYPGALLMSADIPTSGLPVADASRYAQWLDFVSTSGQTAGSGVGQLPAGYLPMTAANGLSLELAYAKAAAVDVSQQNGQVPSVVAPSTQTSGGFPKAGGSGGTTGTVSGSGSGTNSSRGQGSGARTSAGGLTTKATAQPNRGSRASGAPVALAAGRTTTVSSGAAGLAAVFAILLAFAGSVWTGAAWVRRKKVRG